jgi:hypothetical protein
VVAIDNFDLTVPGRRCEKANRHAMETIRRLRPRLVILAQSGLHAETEWPRIAGSAIAMGAGEVAIVGPFPIWRPSLPRVFGEHHLRDRAEYVQTGLDQGSFAVDRLLAARLSQVPDVTYISLLTALCRDGGCLARVPGEGELDLMVLDSGHLTPLGSSHVGRVVFKPYLNTLGIP